MKKRVLLVVWMGVLAAFAFLPNQTPTQAQGLPIVVQITPNGELRQGHTAILRVAGGGGNLVKVNATLLGNRIELYRTNVGDWAGLLGIDMEAPAGGHTLDIYYWTAEDAAPQTYSQQVNVVLGGFDYQEIPIPYNLEPLLDQDLNDYDFGTIEDVQQRATDEIFFTDFQQPVPGVVISGFGQVRNYNNGTLRGRHTGIDFPAAIGTAVMSVANGRVVFAQMLPIHGNHIIIDHGWGVLTGYSHMSDISVVPGELVRGGQVIGLSGATGRVQGPHLHFEVAVNGSWVDGQQFLALEIPMPAPTNP